MGSVLDLHLKLVNDPSNTVDFSMQLINGMDKRTSKKLTSVISVREGNVKIRKVERTKPIEHSDSRNLG